MSDSNWRHQHRRSAKAGPTRPIYDRRRRGTSGAVAAANIAPGMGTDAVVSTFPRHQKIVVVAMTVALLIAIATSAHAVDIPADAIYQTRGPDGEVSFNNFGVGNIVALAPAREISQAERDEQIARQQGIRELADRLERERRARSLHRAKLAQSTARRQPAPNVSDSTFNQRSGFFFPRRFSNFSRFNNGRFNPRFNRRFNPRSKNGRFDKKYGGSRGYVDDYGSKGYSAGRHFGSSSQKAYSRAKWGGKGGARHSRPRAFGKSSAGG